MQIQSVHLGKHDYVVTSDGNVFRIFTDNTCRQLKPTISSQGYCTVNLGRKPRKIHRLVAIAFIPNPEAKRTVNHKDGDKKNNCITNLEWATHSENHLHAFRELGRKKEKPYRGGGVYFHKGLGFWIARIHVGAHGGIYVGCSKEESVARQMLIKRRTEMGLPV